MVILCSLMLRLLLVAAGDVMYLDIKMGLVAAVMLCSLMLRWKLIATGDVM